VRDLTTEVEDRKISSQVLRQCRYRPGDNSVRKRGVEAAHCSILERREERESTDQGTEVWEKFHPAYSGDRTQELLTIDFLRKYIKFCKRRTPPVLSPEASEEIAERYVNMRLRFQQTFVEGSGNEKKGKLAVTTRTLESLIRLSTAHAKLKLRGGGTADEPGQVTVEDVKVAANLLLEAREEAPPPTTPEDDAQDGDGAGGDDDDDGSPPEQGRRKRQRRKGPVEEVEAEAPSAGDEGIGAQRLAVFRTLLSSTFRRAPSQPEAELLALVNNQIGEGEQPFSQGEFEAGLILLEAQNKIMRAQGTVYIVG